MTLKEDIKKQRPKLSEGSLNTYASLLKSLYNKVFEDIFSSSINSAILAFAFSVRVNISSVTFQFIILDLKRNKFLLYIGNIYLDEEH